MRKIISLCLVFITFITCLCTNVSASDDSEIAREKLKKLLNYLNENVYNPSPALYGNYSLYNDGGMTAAYKEADLLCVTENVSAEEYTSAYNNLVYKITHRSICPWYAEDTLLNAEKLENYNNWYSDDDWNEFQQKIATLRASFNGVPYSREPDDYYKDLSKFYDQEKITEAFLDLNDTYNRITNKDYLKGDVNGDGSIDVLDAEEIQKFVTDRTQFTGAQIMRACVGDINSKKSWNTRKFNPLEVDYTEITILDAIAVQKYSVGKMEEFPDYGITLKEAVERAETTNQGYDETFIRRHLLNYTLSPSRGFVDNFHHGHNELFNGYYYVGPAMEGFL